MVAQREPQRMTVDEWRELERTSHDIKHEYIDRGRKFSLYRACPTVQEYVLIATRYQAVEVYRRTPQGWAIYQSYGPGDKVELTSLDVRFPLAALYKNAGVPEAIEDLE